MRLICATGVIQLTPETRQYPTDSAFLCIVCTPITGSFREQRGGVWPQTYTHIQEEAFCGRAGIAFELVSTLRLILSAQFCHSIVGKLRL